MNRKTFLLGCLALTLVTGSASAEVTGVDNWKAFYGSGWAQQTKAIQTEQTFTTLYTNMYLKQYGTLKSRKISESTSSFGPMNAVLMYDAEFSKKKGKLAVNWFKEGGTWKIQQLQVAP